MAAAPACRSARRCVYDAYQGELERVNQRIAGLIESYAADYLENVLTDDSAARLTDEMLEIEQAEVDMRKSFVPRLNAVLPATKVARYLQIERKIRAIIAYEIAAGVPLAE